jgi:curli biogenesis system outer membrane secretion channel CsgG
MSLSTFFSACAPFCGIRSDQYKFEKPRVAVLDFENKASFSQQWRLSEGMRDLLVDALLKTDRYTVLTRRELGAVLSEHDLQREPYFRQEGKIQHGRLKNLQYLIKGAVTDFAHVKGSALRVIGSTFGIGGSGNVAVVSVTLYIIDVESGEIVASETMEGTASAGSLDFKTTYQDVVFGGKAFFRTPLGKATQEVMEQCLEEIAEVVAVKQWYPSVVKVNGDQVLISGGQDRHVKLASLWSVYTPGEALVDPKTGDVLGREPGGLSGLIRVNKVHDKYSEAEILEGHFMTGQDLRPVRSTQR